MKIFVDENIELNQLKSSDSVDIFNMFDSQREYFSKWLPFVELTNKIEDTQNFVDSALATMSETSDFLFTINFNSEFVGLIGFKDTDKQNQKTEIGYWLSKSSQGKGIVTKSVEKLLVFAFDEMNINRVQIKVAVGNEKSNNIPRRLGFTFEGIERDGELLTGNVFTDLYVYSKLKSDF